jgi:hypothetical protein
MSLPDGDWIGLLFGQFDSAAKDLRSNECDLIFRRLRMPFSTRENTQ